MQDNSTWMESSPLSLFSSESPESSDTWDKRSNSSSESVSGSDTSGSGIATICLTVCPDFVCRKTVSKWFRFRHLHLNCHYFSTVNAFSCCIEHSIQSTASAVVE
ncbi:hypothetical protein D917_03795 [Trichinella nativa]|uniref:Uncharacterized protein n=1 Tax=Trichinella nativa TaxID=6335 RepID=A0A1Y3E6R4_9BILA|nr:hypothetical protein D917_03795 [Trichinella nativa]